MHVADVRGWGHITGQGACRLEEGEAIEIQSANARLIAAAPTLFAERNRLRVALVQLVGVDGPAELAEMEAVMRLMPAPAEDKAATIDAIHALIATLPTEKAETK